MSAQLSGFRCPRVSSPHIPPLASGSPHLSLLEILSHLLGASFSQSVP